MTRRPLLYSLCLAGLLVASAARADFVDAVRQQLQAQGYQQVSVSSTLLGRAKIVARDKTGTREIILNPRTGEVLRDLWFSTQGTAMPSIARGSGPAGAGNSGGGDDGDDDNGGSDNGGDDDGGDDDSGHGGGDDKGGDDKGGDDKGGDDKGGDDGGDD